MVELRTLRRGILLDQKFTSFLLITINAQFLCLAACFFVKNTEEKQRILFNNLERHVKTKSAQQKQKWISVENKTPEHEPGKWSDPVIAMSDIGLVFILSYYGGWLS